MIFICDANWLDPTWKGVAGKELKIYPTVKSKETGEFLEVPTGFLEVATDAGSEIHLTVTEPTNNPVLVGKVETNIASFRPCRYDKIELKKQGEAGSTLLFDASKDEYRAMKTIEIEIIAGKKETYLVDFDIHAEECESKPKHSHKEILITSHPASIYVVTVDTSSKAPHIIKNESTLVKSEIKSSANHTIFGGLKSDEKIEIVKETGSFKIREKQLEFDGFYNYDINFNLGAASAFAGIMKYFWLPNLGNRIPKFAGSVTTCAFDKPLNIKIYPDIKWSFAFGFNVEEDQLTNLMPSWDKDKTIQKFEWKAEKFSQKFKDGVSEEEKKKINDRVLGEFEKVHGKAKEPVKKEKESKTKGKLGTLLEIMKQVDVSLKAQLYGENELELTKDFFENAFNSKIYKDIYEKVAWAVDMIDGKLDKPKDKAGGDDAINEYLKENELTKRTQHLIEALKRKPQEVEILYPKFTLGGGWHYEPIDGSKYPLMSGRVGLGYNLALVAKPLIGIQITWHILDLLCRRHPIAYAVLAAVKALLTALGDNPDGIKVDFWVKGEINASLQFDGNYQVGSKSITSKGEAHITAGVEISIMIVGKVMKGRYEAIATVGVGGTGEVGLGLEGSLGVDDQGIWLQTSLIFDGIKLSFEATAEVKVKKRSVKPDGTEESSDIFESGGKIEGEITLLNHSFESDKFYIK
ncbi:MAG TPA: hypothetical protein VF677_10100 [Flavobacterium sp.]